MTTDTPRALSDEEIIETAHSIANTTLDISHLYSDAMAEYATETISQAILLARIGYVPAGTLPDGVREKLRGLVDMMQDCDADGDDENALATGHELAIAVRRLLDGANQ